MAVYKLLDFSDIYTAVMEELKIQSSDTTNLNRIKRAINNTYINEVLPAQRWYWLVKNTAVTHRNYFANGTVSVTPGSTTITLSVAPGASDGDSGSLLGWTFSANNANETYKVTAHTALATAVTIDRPYNGDLDTAAEYKIWPEFVNLPTDCRETIEVWHDHLRSPMVGKGLQEFRQVMIEGQKYEGRPEYYQTTDFYDPTSGTAETESDRYRQLRVWPNISQYKTLIKVDYVVEADALNLDGDEPLMPIEDRIVLVYGALAKLWRSIGRSTEDSQINESLFQQKLAKMMGKVQDSMDKPRIEPDSRYMVARRGNRSGARGASAFSGGGSSVSSPTYAENITINGATITGNVTVNSGITIDGVDISVLNTSVSTLSSDLTTHIADTNTHGITSTIVGISETQTLTNKTIDADSNSITNIENADIKTGAAITRAKLATGTAYRILANDASGVISENAAITASRAVVSDSNGQLAASAITSTEVTYLDDVEALTTFAMSDNQASAANVATWAHASFTAVILDYSISRGSGNREVGTIQIATDGSTAGIATSGASIGASGVTFSVDISGADLRLRYVSTSTGTAPSMKYKVNKWLA